MAKEIYYAHAKPWYGTRLEERDIEAITEHFGVEPTNPALINMPHGRSMGEYEEIAAPHDVSSTGRSLATSRPGCAARPRQRSSAAGGSSG